MAGKTNLGAMIAGMGLIIGAAALPTAAAAGGTYGGGNMGGGGCHCQPPPPPPPPQPPCCAPPPGHTVNIPGVNVNVAASVIVNTEVNVQANAAAAASSQTFFSGGGGGGGIIAPTASGYIQGLNTGGERSSYEATRTLYKKVVIQAFCFDDKLTPHPASQVTPDRDIESAYEGELYRCIAGAHMQVTIADWKENISFEGGQTLTCQKGEALWHGAGPQGGTLQCRPQRPARDCNERSLLRRFGAGIKVLTMLITEKYTAYRQESTTTSGAVGMSLDGGVGGIAY